MTTGRINQVTTFQFSNKLIKAQQSNHYLAEFHLSLSQKGVRQLSDNQDSKATRPPQPQKMQLQSNLITTSHPCSPISQILNHFSLSPYWQQRSQSSMRTTISQHSNKYYAQPRRILKWLLQQIQPSASNPHSSQHASKPKQLTYSTCVTHGHNQPNVNVTASLIISRYTLQSRYIDDLLHNRPTIPFTRRPQRVVEHTRHKSNRQLPQLSPRPAFSSTHRSEPRKPVPNRHLH